MSTTLMWRPRDIGLKRLSLEMKLALQDEYGGAINGLIMDEKNMGFLRGLRHSEVLKKDADILIQGILEYAEIELTEMQ